MPSAPHLPRCGVWWCKTINNYMKQRILTFIEDCIIAIACFLSGHSWLSKSWNIRKCNRCGLTQIKSAITGYKWQNQECVVKPFNPCK